MNDPALEDVLEILNYPKWDNSKKGRAISAPTLSFNAINDL